MPLSLSKHYHQMWDTARSHFLEGKIARDPLLDDPTDDRYGITLLLRPDKITKHHIQDFLHDIAALEPDQYYYPESDMHLTILSIISCYSGFQLEDIDIHAYDRLIKEALTNIPPVSIHFKGITASPSTILIQGFPEDDTLERLRNQLRDIFRNSALRHTIDSRYTLFTAHSTVIRFRKALRDPEGLINTLDSYRETDFGRINAQQLELVGNDWYQRQAKVKVLNTYTLSSDRS